MSNGTDQNPSAEQRNNPTNGLSQMSDGRWINLYNLHESDISIEQIAHNISRLCRYNGAVAGFICVGRHSIRCCLAALQLGYGFDVALQCLGHDFGEAFFGDLVRPLKNDPQMRARYLEIEEAGEHVICSALNITYPFDPRVKEMDMMDSKLEMGDNNDGERFDPDRWDDIQQTEADIVFMYHWLIAARDGGERAANRLLNLSRVGGIPQNIHEKLLDD